MTILMWSNFTRMLELHWDLSSANVHPLESNHALSAAMQPLAK